MIVESKIQIVAMFTSFLVLGTVAAPNQASADNECMKGSTSKRLECLEKKSDALSASLKKVTADLATANKNIEDLQKNPALPSNVKIKSHSRGPADTPERGNQCLSWIGNLQATTTADCNAGDQQWDLVR